MIRIFKLPEYSQLKLESLTEIEDRDSLRKQIAWVDLQDPSTEQIKEVEIFYGVKFFIK